jgi:hypothetical protein
LHCNTGTPIITAKTLPARTLVYEKRLSAGCLLDLVQTQVDMCSQNFQEILLGNLNLKFPVEAQLEMVRRS